MSRAVVLLSGGLDSAVCLVWARHAGHQLTALSFDYHLRGGHEKRAAEVVARAAGAELVAIAVPFLKELSDLRAEGRSPPGLAGAPEGYVPARNLVLYAIGTSVAEAIGADLVVGGHLRRDAEAFPDASAGFFRALEDLVALGSVRRGGSRIAFTLPLAGMRKSEVVRLGRELGVPFGHTWSCYGDGERPCGRCVSCAERAEAFREAGLPDPAAP